jgi:DNA-binding beta-propeller fold protein YncE
MSIKKKLLEAAAGIGGSSVNAWTLNDPTMPGDGTFYLGAQEVYPTDIFFKPDGTKMYVVGGADAVTEYNLSTAWDVSTASYNQNFSVSAQESIPVGLFFKPDGTKMYVSGRAGEDVNEYSLSTAWDISTASYVRNFSVAAQDTYPTGVSFKPDGTKMYVLGSTGDAVSEYSLSTAWNISTASYVRNFSVAAQETSPQGIFFKPDGTKMYVVGLAGRDVNEYNLSTAWNVSTASYVRNFSVSIQETNPNGVFFKPDGTQMYVVGINRDTVYEYSLSTAWDISTASWNGPEGHYFSVSAQEGSPNGIFFKPDGTQMYVVGSTGDDVNEYSLSTAWNVSTASYVRNFSVSAQETSPQGIFFKPDGTQMYVVGSTGDDVNEYSLSTAWDVSTASYVRNFSLSAQETYPTGIFFKSDGTKMYVVGRSGDDVNEYNLSTAWNVSTVSYVQNFSVAAQETYPQDIFFKPDGTQMYVIGSSGDAVYEYSLSTDWDVSTASYVQNFSVAAQMNFPTGLQFKSDGTQMYAVGNTSDAVWAYDLTN